MLDRGRQEEKRHVEVSSTFYRREYSERAESNYLPARQPALCGLLPRTQLTHAYVITCVCLRKREYPGRREGGRVRVVRDFAVDSLIGKQLITGQESRYKRYSIQLPLPLFHLLFFSLHNLRFAVSVSPPFFCLTSSPLRVHRRFLLTHRSSPRSFFCQFQLFSPVHDSLISHLVFFYPP